MIIKMFDITHLVGGMELTIALPIPYYTIKMYINNSLWYLLFILLFQKRSDILHNLVTSSLRTLCGYFLPIFFLPKI